MNAQLQPQEDLKNLLPSIALAKKTVKETRGETMELFGRGEDKSAEGTAPLSQKKNESNKKDELKLESLEFYIKEALASGLDQDEARKRAAAKRTLIMQQIEDKRVDDLAKKQTPLTKEHIQNKFLAAIAMLEQIKTMDLEGVAAVYTDPEWQINDKDYGRMLKIRKLVLSSKTKEEMKELFDKVSLEDQELFDRASIRDAAENREIELKVDEHFEIIITPEAIPVETVEVPVDKKLQATG